MATVQRIVPCLWFNTEAEEAANFYVSIFKDAKITEVTRYGSEGHDVHGQPAGRVMTVSFELDGMPFLALNGGPQYQFSEAVSLQVMCDSQDEIDYYWDRLTAGGEEGPCGWLKDKYGLSWQIVPTILPKLLRHPDPDKVNKVTAAFMKMKKLDIATLEQAGA